MADEKSSKTLWHLAFGEALMWDLFPVDIPVFTESAIKPQFATRKKFGYKRELYPGVYKSDRILEQEILLISLNELSDEPYNALFKIFATHQIEKQKAFQTLENSRNVSTMPRDLQSLFSGLLSLGEEDMNYEFTPEQVQKIGKIWGKAYLSSIPVKERLADANPIEVMNYLKLKPVERLAGLTRQELNEVEKYLKQFKQDES